MNSYNYMHHQLHTLWATLHNCSISRFAKLKIYGSKMTHPYIPKLMISKPVQAHKRLLECVSSAIMLCTLLAQLPGGCLWTACFWQIINVSFVDFLGVWMHPLPSTGGWRANSRPSLTHIYLDGARKLLKINPYPERMCTNGKIKVTNESKRSHSGDMCLCGSGY